MLTSPTIQSVLRSASRAALRAICWAALCLTLAAPAMACPNCKDAQNSKTATGYYYSILFMMGSPPTILAVWGLALYRTIRNARREQDVDATNQSTEQTSPGDNA